MRKTVQEGDVYGRLTVVQRDGVRGKAAMWLCRCSCGNSQLKRIAGGNLVGGSVQSCGCLTRSNEHRHKTHGLSATRVYRIWKAMKNRCLRSTDPFFHRYGGRGIRVDERWLKFENFYSDMGEPPTDKHSLDRVDGDGHYTLANCRWATPTEQQNNRSTNRLLTVNGETATIAEWSRRTGLAKSTIRERLQRKWSAAEAIRKVDQV